jgi:signal transduction histidine kinase
MNIRAKLTITFFGIVAVVLTAISVSIYYFSANYREVDFYRRLRNRAINTGKILTEVKEVNAELLKRMERNNPASLPNQFILIFNQKNEELYSSEGTRIIQVDTALLNEIRAKNEIKFTHDKYEALGFVFVENHDRFTMIAAATDVYGLDALRNLRNVLLITFSISLVLVSILGWLYAGKVLSPISKIVNEVSTITEANLNQRLEEGDQKDELNQLARTFNRMLERLQSAFIAQKNFIANASHEIKTPITVMTGEIDVALLQERTKEYYITSLKSVLAALKRLNKLSTQLLLLAQTSAEQPEKSFTLVRVDDILWEVKAQLIKAHPEYNIDIIFDLKLDYEWLSIYGDEQLLKVAILNLMENGCKYADDNHVTINLHSNQPQLIAVEFTNNGGGIDMQNIEKLFEPFYRGKNGRQTEGFGIGLSLVSKIIKLHNGRISVTSIPQTKTCFTVEIPAMVNSNYN